MIAKNKLIIGAAILAIILLAVTCGTVLANHEGDGAIHCANMHSHPIEHHGSESWWIPAGYEQHNGYVHCHDPEPTPPGQTVCYYDPVHNPNCDPDWNPYATPTPTATPTSTPKPPVSNNC